VLLDKISVRRALTQLAVGTHVPPCPRAIERIQDLERRVRVSVMREPTRRAAEPRAVPFRPVLIHPVKELRVTPLVRPAPIPLVGLLAVRPCLRDTMPMRVQGPPVRMHVGQEVTPREVRLPALLVRPEVTREALEPPPAHP
jgi:hypothetical protein